MKRVLSSMLLTLILIGTLTVTFNIKPAKADWTGTVHIRADGSIYPSDAPITTQDRVTYTLTGNIRSSGDGIIVERDNIILDGNGHTIQGSYAALSIGVSLYNRKNVKIQNINITNFSCGIKLNASFNNTIRGNSITNNNEGISLEGSSSNNNVWGNSITNNGNGIIAPYTSVDHPSSNNFSGNSITNNTNGIYLFYSQNNNISGNSITNNYYGIYLIASSFNNISGNSITNNYYGIYLAIYLFYTSTNNNISGNSITNNYYGIYLIKSSISNTIYHNDFINNSCHVISDSFSSSWDDGYPSGGNYWSDYNGTDKDGDGIGDTPYIIDNKNIDRYPLIKPRMRLPTSISISLRAKTIYNSGNDYITTVYGSPFPGRSFNYFLAVPANVPTVICYTGRIVNNQQILPGKEIKFLIDNQVISTFVTNQNYMNINGTAEVNLNAGSHSCEVRFEGDEEFIPAVQRFTIIAYKSSGFFMGRDSYSFDNWEYTFDEHSWLFDKLSEEGIVDKFMKIPFVAIFPLISAQGHCFGMATASSLYFVNPNLKPKPVDTYKLSKEDAIWDIDYYQFMVGLQRVKPNEISTMLTKIKRSIDSGMPIILTYSIPGFTHAVTVIGYQQIGDETFLICYDNRASNLVYVYSVIDGKLLYDYNGEQINITEVGITELQSLPAPISSVDITSALQQAFNTYLGILIRSPVDIKIKDTNNHILIIQNNKSIINNLTDAHLYISEVVKIVLIPKNEFYIIENTATDRGKVNIDYICITGDKIIVYQYPNITVNQGDKIYLNTTHPENIQIDLGGDGTIDNAPQPIIIPEFPSTQIQLMTLTLATLISLSAYAKFKNKKKTQTQ